MKSFSRVLDVVGLNVVFLAAAVVGSAGEYSVKTIEKAAPSEVSEPIRKLLQGSAMQVLDKDKPVYEFWFVQELPLKSKPDASDPLKVVRETGVLGAVMVHREQRDYKDKEVYPGVYTMRLALMPQDGDHLGTALHPYFAALVPAKADPSPEAFSNARSMIKASGKNTATGHPVVLSLRPSSGTKGETPAINEPESEHKSVRVQLPAKAAGAEQARPVVFELVFEGHGKIQ